MIVEVEVLFNLYNFVDYFFICMFINQNEDSQINFKKELLFEKVVFFLFFLFDLFFILVFYLD